MIYTVIGTNQKKREEYLRTILKDKNVSLHIYSEQVATLRPLVDASSLFGEEIVALLIQLMDSQASRDEVIDLFPLMKESKNIFVIDEPFADANRTKRLEKYSEKLFDCREEKEGEASPFLLCNAFAKRDKKQAFIEWMKIKDVSEPLEMIHGALWWKMRMIWEDTLNGKPTKFTKSECEKFSEEIMKSILDAHRGKVDLKLKLEEVILSV